MNEVKNGRVERENNSDKTERERAEGGCCDWRHEREMEMECKLCKKELIADEKRREKKKGAKAVKVSVPTCVSVCECVCERARSLTRMGMKGSQNRPREAWGME